MFKIITPANTGVNFLQIINLPLSRPQKNHTINFIDTLFMDKSAKTIAKLNRPLLLLNYHPSPLIDFFKLIAIGKSKKIAGRH
ncbi:MAG: hypothetical protein ABIK93_08945 [candidate division WOR-3 bacterium]